MGNEGPSRTPAREQAVSATLVLNRGSAGVWLGVMVCRIGDKVEQFTGDGPSVAAVSLALTKQLIEAISGVKSAILMPHYPPKIPNLGGH